MIASLISGIFWKLAGEIALTIVVGIGALAVGWYLPQIRALALGVALTAFSYTFVVSRGVHAGYQMAIERIAAKDKEAIEAANKAGADVQACLGDNGEWDVTTGQCRRFK